MAYVVGTHGTGKSTLLADMVHQIHHSGHGALVLDPHGTLVDRIIEELPECAADRVQVVPRRRPRGMSFRSILLPVAMKRSSTPRSPTCARCSTNCTTPNAPALSDPIRERLGYALRGLALLRKPGQPAGCPDHPWTTRVCAGRCSRS